ncbi:unnamed protein product [Caretta caretta]
MALRRVQVLSFLREGGYSVIFLQETHTDPTAEDSWRLEWGDRVYFSHSTIRQARVATPFSPDLRPEVLGVTEAMPGRLLHLRVRMEGLVVNLVNVYGPTSGPERLQFYQQVSAFLSALDSHECLVLGGDFNTTLEDTDYKIVAKAISLRLGSVLADVIHPDQTYTVPDHSIFDNLFMVRDLLELGHRDSLSFALMSLDQEKAFDRVDHGYLLSTLQAFGFGPQFVGFLRVLYASAECLVKLNWTVTEPVSFREECCKGAPSPQEVDRDPSDLARVEACQAIYSAASSARVN